MRTCWVSKPGSIDRALRRLRTQSPAPMSSTRQTETCAVKSPLRSRDRRRPANVVSSFSAGRRSSFERRSQAEHEARRESEQKREREHAPVNGNIDPDRQSRRLQSNQLRNGPQREDDARGATQSREQRAFGQRLPD